MCKSIPYAEQNCTNITAGKFSVHADEFCTLGAITGVRIDTFPQWSAKQLIQTWLIQFCLPSHFCSKVQEADPVWLAQTAK